MITGRGKKKACPYMFPDCLSDRLRYMRVAPIDLWFGKGFGEKRRYSRERGARLRAKHFERGRDQVRVWSAAEMEMIIIT